MNKKTIIILSFLLLFLIMGGVSANDTNTTDELSTDETIDDNCLLNSDSVELLKSDNNDSSEISLVGSGSNELLSNNQNSLSSDNSDDALSDTRYTFKTLFS